MTQGVRLQGRRALVTGGSRGIGAAIARRLAAEGATVAINYRSDAACADALLDELSATGRPAGALKADVSDRTQIQALFRDVVEAFGGLHIVASNAGVEHFGALESITPEDFDRVFHINVASQLFVTQAAADAMSVGGRSLLTSSISARFAAHHHTLYAASKAAYRPWCSTWLPNSSSEVSPSTPSHQAVPTPTWHARTRQGTPTLRSSTYRRMR
jgi:3-oxoacyl-[acyl-carrier protein] reductase